jgi:hypothetical protein
MFIFPPSENFLENTDRQRDRERQRRERARMERRLRRELSCFLSVLGRHSHEFFDGDKLSS